MQESERAVMERRVEIALGLMRGCPDRERSDHSILAHAVLRGEESESVLESVECQRWPETYVWLRRELKELK